MKKDTEMTKERLKQYRSKKREIIEIQYSLEHMGDDVSLIGNDTILDYGYYPPKARAVVGVDWEKVDRKETRYYKKIEELEAECKEIELWIEAIPDSITRRIFRLSFVDGLKQKQVAKVIHMEKSSISKKIDKYLKLSPNSPNSTL